MIGRGGVAFIRHEKVLFRSNFVTLSNGAYACRTF